MLLMGSADKSVVLTDVVGLLRDTCDVALSGQESCRCYLFELITVSYELHDSRLEIFAKSIEKLTSFLLEMILTSL